MSLLDVDNGWTTVPATTARPVLLPLRAGYLPQPREIADARRAKWSATTMKVKVVTVRPPSLLVPQLEDALLASTTPWRTVTSLATQLGTDEVSIAEALASMGDRVRRPVGDVRGEQNLYRLTSAGFTWQERWRMWKRVVGRVPTVDDGRRD